MGPGCVKTCASRERAELFSPFSSFDHDGQCCSFLIQRNRDKLSTRKFDVGVFTQPGPRADISCYLDDVNIASSKLTSPSTSVSKLVVVGSCGGGTVNTSWDSTARSAAKPGAMSPLRLSWP